MPPKTSSEKCLVIVTIYKYFEAESNISFNVTDVEKLVKLGMARIDKKGDVMQPYRTDLLGEQCMSENRYKHLTKRLEVHATLMSTVEPSESKLSNHRNMCLQHVSVC